MPDGTVRVIGFTRGYDENSSVRKAYLERALNLGTDNPYLKCRALIDRYFERAGHNWTDTSTLPLRRVFVSELDACVQAAGERVLPDVMRLLSTAYSHVGDPHNACAWLQRTYRFESASFDTKTWISLFGDVQSRAGNPVPGVPKFPGFTCSMPK